MPPRCATRTLQRAFHEIESVSIRSFRCFKTEKLFCSETERLFLGQSVAMFAPVLDNAIRKLAMLDAATDLTDLPPETCPLVPGAEADRWHLPLNADFDLRFSWLYGAAERVEIVRHVCDLEERRSRRRGVTYPSAGEILCLEFLQPRHISIARLSRATGITRYRLRRLTKDQVRFRPDDARAIARQLATTSEFWLNLDAGHGRALRREALAGAIGSGR